MTASHVLLIIGGVIVAIILAFCVIGWAIRILDKPGWWIAGIVALWLIWELIPGAPQVMAHLWSDLQSQLGQVAQGVMR